MSTHIDKGKKGEQLAAEFLQAAGYTIVEQNYRFGHGEIDIIAKDGEYLVFVEVKTRTSDTFGSAIHAVTQAKQKQIAYLARAFLYERQLQDIPCRFDVITVDYKFNHPNIEHIPNAFRSM